MNRPTLNKKLRNRFFSQYLYSCECGEHGEEFVADWDENAFISHLEAEQEDAFLFLRGLDSLTDEEAIEVAKMAYREDYMHTVDEGRWYLIHSEQGKNFKVLEISDYLRSIGICLPFMGYSVDELIEAGFVKITP